MPALTYVQGDATRPGERPAIIAHVCNDQGGWGAGFVLALNKLSPLPKAYYQEWASGRYESPFQLGRVQFVPVGEALVVANMVAQHDYQTQDNPVPLRYGALIDCLDTVDELAHELKCGVHVPRIGCGLAGGKWETVSGFLEGIQSEVTVYDLPTE